MKIEKNIKKEENKKLWTRNELLDAHEKYLPQFKDYYENREKYQKGGK